MNPTSASSKFSKFSDPGRARCKAVKKCKEQSNPAWPRGHLDLDANSRTFAPECDDGHERS